VCAGTYDEQIELIRALTLEGEGASATVIKPDSVAANTSSLASGELIAAILLVNQATDVIVTDFTIDGVDASFNSCSPGYMGNFYRASSGAIENMEVINIHHPTHRGARSSSPSLRRAVGVFRHSTPMWRSSTTWSTTMARTASQPTNLGPL